MRKIRENKYDSNVDVHKWEIYFTRESEKKRYILNKNGRLYYETSCRHSLYSFSCLDDLNLGLFSSFLLLASLAISSGFVRLALRARTRAREKEREKLSFSSYFFYPSCSPFSSCALLFHFFFSYAFLLPLFYTRFILRLAWAFIYSWLCFFYNYLFVSLWHLVNSQELELYFLW